MNREDLKSRTKQFALRVIKLTRALPNKPESWVIGKQILRSSTSVAANYRSACRSRSTAEFVSKIAIVIEESDESSFWLELIADSELLSEKQVSGLLKESNEITAIMVSSRKTASKKLNNKS